VARSQQPLQDPQGFHRAARLPATKRERSFGAAPGTISELRASMANLVRPVLLALSISIVPLVAEAGRDRGGGGGGGRLGQVSSGLGQASGGGSRGGGGGGSSGGAGGSTSDGWVRDHREHEEVEPVQPGYVVGLSEGPPTATPPKPSSVTVDFYLGAQKVYESDGAWSAELAFNEGRLRLGGAISRYYEQQRADEPLTFTLASLYLGLRIDDGGRTRTHLELGAVGATTDHDPEMDTSLTGVSGGVRVEHRLSRRAALVGDAQVVAFKHDVRAGALRAGIRYRHFQATVRYFDLNVGPALFGPELGISF
jgi:hypothetical protein